MADAVTTSLTGSETLRTVLQPPPAIRSTLQPPPVFLTTLAVGQGPIGPAGPPGVGDMQSLVYDPSGMQRNAFDLANLSGNLDGGTFT